MLNSIADQEAVYHRFGPDAKANQASRPDPNTKTGRVWEIADEITREKGRCAKRREVIARFTAENGNPGTASTQYQRWKKWRKQQPGLAAASPDKPCDVKPQSLKVAPDGRFSVPVEMREAMLLGDDGRVTARVEAGELRIVSPVAAVKQIQSRMRKYRKPGESIVDQFLADRQAMWGED